MLVGVRILHDRGGMNAGLGHEGAFANIGRMAVRRAVQHVVERARHLHQRRHLLRGDADLEGVGELVLQAQRRDQRAEIGVAAALAEPIQRALDLPRAGTYRGQRIGDRLLGIVMGVDADMAARDMLDHVATMVSTSCGMVPPLVSHSTTQRAPEFIGRLGAGQREIGVLLVAVEEVLAIDHHLAPRRLRSNDAVADRGEVFLVGGLQRHPHLIGRGLGDEADRIGFGLDQRRKPRIVRGRTAGRRVMPNAVNLALSNFGLSEKNSVSVGLAPG